MIIPLEGRYGEKEFVVFPRGPKTIVELRDRMLQRAKVTEGSYAYRLIDDLHAAIFIRSVDLKADYEAYFGLEYESFGEYLRRRTRFPRAVVAMLAKTVDRSIGVYHLRSTYAFMDDSYGLEFLTRLLEDPPVGEES